MTIQHRRRWLRLPFLALIAAAALSLAACASPSTFPNGNNATCWEKQQSTTKEEPVCDNTAEKWTDFGANIWLWSQCSSSGTTLYQMHYDQSKCRTYDRTLLNKGHADLIAQVFFGQDDAGYPVIAVYCIWPNKEPTRALTVRWDFGGDDYTMAPSGLETSTGLCSAPVELTTLTSGGYEVRIGPDKEGKIAVMGFSDLPPDDLHFYDTYGN